MEKKDFPAIALDIMERADILSLATYGEEDYPYIRALFNLRNTRQFPAFRDFLADKGLTVYLGTNSSSVKMRQTKAADKVSVYYMLPAEFKGLMLCGKAVADEKAKEAIWMDGWEQYYSKGRTDPDYTVLRIEPVLARGWYAGQAFEFDL